MGSIYNCIKLKTLFSSKLKTTVEQYNWEEVQCQQVRKGEGGNMVIILRKCLPICKPYMQNCPKLDSSTRLQTGEASPEWQCMKTGAINWVWLASLVRTKNCWPKWFGEESASTKANCGLSGNSRSRLWSQRWRRAVRSYCFDLTHTQIPMATQELCI